MADQRTNIVSKANELFHQYGIKSVSMDDICRELGISKKTLYSYFATKDELVEATLLMIRTCVGEKMDAFFAENKTIWEHVLKFTERAMKQEDVRKVPVLVYDLNKYYPALAKKHNKLVYDQNLDAMRRLLSKGVEEKVFRQQLDVEATAHLLAKMHEVAVEDSVEKNDPRLSPERMMHGTMDIVMRGILSADGLAEYDRLMDSLRLVTTAK